MPASLAPIAAIALASGASASESSATTRIGSPVSAEKSSAA
jgi:hypothetical protein